MGRFLRQVIVAVIVTCGHASADAPPATAPAALPPWQSALMREGPPATRPAAAAGPLLERYAWARAPQERADLLWALAETRTPTAAVALGEALRDAELDVRMAATYGLQTHFDVRPLSGGSEQHMRAAADWWVENEARLRREAADQPLQRTGAAATMPWGAAPAAERQGVMRTIDQNLISGWLAGIRAKRVKRGTKEYERRRRASFEVMDLCNHDPEAAWRFVLTILAADRSPRVMESLSAGPLEDLLAKHPHRAIEWVEGEARTNPDFARLLGGVWQNAMPEDVWARVRAVRDRRGWDGIPAA